VLSGPLVRSSTRAYEIYSATERWKIWKILIFFNPTKIVFGKGKENKIGGIIKKYIDRKC